MTRKFIAALVALFVFVSIFAFQAILAYAGGNPSNPITLDLPVTVASGHQPFTMTITVTNNRDHSVSFSSFIRIGGDAWGRETMPYSFSSNSDVYWMEGGTEAVPGNYLGFWWRGTLQKGESAAFTLPTYSGDVLGTFDFLDATFVIQSYAPITIRWAMTVAASTPTSTGTISTRTPTQTSTPTATRTPFLIDCTSVTFSESTTEGVTTVTVDGSWYLAIVADPSWESVDFDTNNLRIFLHFRVPRSTISIYEAAYPGSRVCQTYQFGNLPTETLTSTPTATQTPTPTAIQSTTPSVTPTVGSPPTFPLLVSMSQGWNAIGLPCYPCASLSAENLLDQFNQQGMAPVALVGWKNGNWVVHMYKVDDGSNFQLQPGDGYFIRLNQGGTWYPRVN